MKYWLILGAVLQLILSGWEAESKLEPTKFQNNGVYALENQHTGKYLAVGENGEFVRAGDHGTPSQNQKWRFILAKDSQTGIEGWQLVPLNGAPSQASIYKEIYVGHGKFILRNPATGKCLESSSRGVEVQCIRNDLLQRWYPHPLS